MLIKRVEVMWGEVSKSNRSSGKIGIREWKSGRRFASLGSKPFTLSAFNKP